ncbi:MAG TPA: hypothetical protein VGR26_04600 [Acidimicrobiales bacterium]|nr:hypothetical protein [Acidimicrobiales bacterium]
MSPHLDHARRVADPSIGPPRQPLSGQGAAPGAKETLRHRGRKRNPLHRIRKLLLSGHERLDQVGHQRMLLGLRVGDPADEVLWAWLAKESVRDVCLAEDPAEAALLLDKAIAGCADDDVEEIRCWATPWLDGPPRFSPITTPAPPTVPPRGLNCA